ncbi:unnamed protein product [Tuber melanosporum]|uniref:(Perigord truffle) hypothetical protein n=1 Tax=Tuber melanosporum (strain Mel28) TaxID=656061 RepID=D5GGA4_TUBMM|nr:uncharacterized protein GSTUM_00007292001 [Tuber melanosporum]CAZ83547.1 unnamed protein product [Tuber melanosporum]
MTSGTYRSPGSRNRLESLDLLSILLVTESSDDVAAISIYRTAADRIELWYSKDRPCTEIEKANITKFIQSAARTAHLSKPAREDLLRIALRMCKRKVFACIYEARHLMVRFSRDGSYGIIPRASQADHDLRDAATIKLRRILGENDFPSGRSLEAFLTLLFQAIILAIRPGVPFDIAANVEFYFEAVIRCHALLQVPVIDTVIEGTLLGRLMEIADYYTAVAIAHREIQKLSPGGKAYLIRSIREIPPSSPTTYLTPPDPLTCLNHWARYRGLTLSSSSSPSSLPAFPGKTQIRECTHPEATLITKIISAHKSSPTVLRDIGSSRISCWICQEFSAAACDLYPGICIRLSREMLATAGSWKFPVDTPACLVLALTRRVERAMGMVFEGVDSLGGIGRGVKRKIGEMEG